MKNFIIGILLVVLGWQFGRAETQYFGNNMVPITWQELVCDLIALTIISIGYFRVVKGLKLFN